MTVSASNLSNLRGILAIKDLKRTSRFETPPSEKISASSTNTFLSGSGSRLGRSQESAIANIVARSVDLKSETKPSENNLKVVVEDRSSDPRENQIYNYDESIRSQRTKGFGDRAYGITNTTPVETPKLYPLTASDELANPNLVIQSNAQPQSTAVDLRGAVLELSSRYVLNNPDTTEEDLQTQIDSFLGDGTSALFNLHLQDRGGGVTSVVIDQVEYQDLNLPDKLVFDTAAENVAMNFASLDSNRSLEGSDIQKTLSDLNSLLGPEGAPLVLDLRQSLLNLNSPDQAINDFLKKATDLNLSESDQANLTDLVNQLKSADNSAVSSFDENALVDNFSHDYVSNRYGNAHSPATIAARAALTADTLFLGK